MNLQQRINAIAAKELDAITHSVSLKIRPIVAGYVYDVIEKVINEIVKELEQKKKE